MMPGSSKWLLPFRFSGMFFVKFSSLACYMSNPSNPRQSDDLNNIALTIQSWCSTYNFTNVWYSAYLTLQVGKYFSAVVTSFEKQTVSAAQNMKTGASKTFKAAKYSCLSCMFFISQYSFQCCFNFGNVCSLWFVTWLQSALQWQWMRKLLCMNVDTNKLKIHIFDN
jgi:hypothetical protein